MAKMKEYTAEEMKTKLAEARELVRKFKMALPGNSDRNVKAYQEAKKTVAQILTKMNKK